MVLYERAVEACYDGSEARLWQYAIRPSALFDQFKIDVLASTESALNDPTGHQMICDSVWTGRIVTTYRPDAAVDPEFEGFAAKVTRLGGITTGRSKTWDDDLKDHRKRRAWFKTFGATATGHDHPTTRIEDLPRLPTEVLFQQALTESCTA